MRENKMHFFFQCFNSYYFFSAIKIRFILKVLKGSGQAIAYFIRSVKLLKNDVS